MAEASEEAEEAEMERFSNRSREEKAAAVEAMVGLTSTDAGILYLARKST